MLHDDRSKAPDTPACAGPRRRRPGLARTVTASPGTSTSRWSWQRRPTRALVCVLTAAVLAAVTSACGSGSGARAGAAAGGVEKSTVTVRVIPTADLAPMYLAMQRGYFAAEGLTVKPQLIQNGSVAIQAMQQGSLDVVNASYVSFFLAQSKGAAFKVVSDGYQAGANMQVVVTLPGSPIRHVRDLAGKRIGVGTPQSIAQLAAMSTLQTNGVNPAGVKFVQVDWDKMAVALRTKRIDAAYELEPYLSGDQQRYGVVKVFDAMAGPTADLALSGYVTTADWARKYPRTFAAFQRAMAKGQAAAADRSAVERILPTFTKIDAKAASVINLGSYPTTVSKVRLQRVVDLMVTFGLLPSADKAGLDSMLSTP